MAYTVKKLAKLSGVSIRTLHFYDEIGLLKPARYGDNGYRYYEEEQLLLLQQVLFFRELGFQLNDIQRILGSDDFDKIQALNSHRHILKASLERTDKLLRTIDKTIAHLKGNLTMRDEELFQGFDPVKQKEYEKYLIDSGRVTQEEIDKGRERIKDWKKEDWETIKREGEEGHRLFVAAINAGQAPADDEVQKLVRRHYDWVKRFWVPDREKYIGLGRLYCEHTEFRKYFDDYHLEYAEFLAEAMRVFAERELI